MTVNDESKKRRPLPHRETALVTGAGSGIGAAIAQRLAARGTDLVLVGRDSARLESAARRLRDEHGTEVLTLPLDLSARDAPTLLAKRLRDTGVEIDLLVNNAGAALVGPVAGADPGRRAPWWT